MHTSYNKEPNTNYHRDVTRIKDVISALMNILEEHGNLQVVSQDGGILPSTFMIDVASTGVYNKNGYFEHNSEDEVNKVCIMGYND